MAIADVAGGITDELHAMIKQRMEAQLLNAKMQEMQAQQQNERQRIGLEGRRVDQGDRSLTQNDSHFNQTFGLDKDKFGFTRQTYADAAPERAAELAHTTASTNEILRQPSAEQIARDFTTSRDKAQYGYRLGEIGKQGENALAVANVRPKPTPMLFTGADGKPRAVDFSGGNAREIPLPGDVTSGKGGANATLDNRLESAKAVVQTGNDISQMLRNPKMAEQLGQAMSRYNSVADFVGNAPPEWSKLAGQIESYSLANMGVHGMRSTTGAEAIKQTLGQERHTPESMIAALEGLNGFANHLLENNGKGGGDAGAGGGGGASAGQPKAGDTKVFPNGRKAVYDGTGWVAQ